MTQHNYFTLTFLIRKARMSRAGEAPIFARLTISGQRAEFNINRSVDPDNWNSAKGISKGKSKRDIELNKYLDSIRVRISEIHASLVKDEEAINPLIIKQHFLGNAEGPKMLCDVFNYVNDQHKERFDRGDICNGTYLRWKRCAEYIAEFIQKREGRNDIPIKKLTSGMIDDFEHFLRVNKGNGNNAAVRYVRYLKKVTRVALANKWLDEGPFIDKHYSRTTTNRGHLGEDEVKKIMALNLSEFPASTKCVTLSSSAASQVWRLPTYPHSQKSSSLKMTTGRCGYASPDRKQARLAPFRFLTFHSGLSKSMRIIRL